MVTEEVTYYTLKRTLQANLVLTFQTLDLYLNNTSCFKIPNRISPTTKYVLVAPFVGTENLENLEASMILLAFS